MTYARARLWLGISGVGFFVLVSSVALWLNLPARAFAQTSAAASISLTLVMYIFLSLPFDFLGGYLIPRRYRRTDCTFGAFLTGWARGVICQALIMGLSAAIILQAARRGGTLAGFGAFILLMGLLLVAQLPVAQLIGGLRQSAGPLPPVISGMPQSLINQLVITVHESSDPAFVGGLVGVGSHPKLVLPAAWLSQLPAATVFMQITRRLGVLKTGARNRGVGLAILWNAFGFVAASHLPRASLINAPGLIGTGLWCTLWSFVGLLLLPSVNRPGVLEADRFALDHGVEVQTLHEGMVELDQLQDDEPERTRWIERVFHPIPSVASRMAALRTDSKTKRGAWQGARITLYLSWACFGFLARAVHCNVGRPEIWVLFPGD